MLDAFHVIALAGRALTQVRQRVQQQTLGRRGRKQDPLYRIRCLLPLGAEHLTDTTRTRLEAGLQAGDPDLEVTVAWHCYQRLRAAYHHPHPRQGRRAAQRLLDQLPGCPIPEIARLGRTLRAWRHQLLAYFDTGGASNGPTEAINLLIEKIRRLGHGFRNFDNYRLRLLLHCGVVWQNPPTLRIRNRSPRLVA